MKNKIKIRSKNNTAGKNQLCHQCVSKMKYIKPMMLLVPFIVLIIVLIFYFIVLKKETDKILFKRFVLITIILSFILNFTWEILQMPLYANNKLDFQHLVFCGLATVADTVMVLCLVLK